MGPYFKKILQLITTGSFTLVMCAKYGVPIDVTTKMIKTKTQSDQPIAGLKVILYENNFKNDSLMTDRDGMAVFDNVTIINSSNTIAKITDIDGENNLGKFKDTSITLTKIDYYEVIMKKGK